jgi:hypothetical protein
MIMMIMMINKKGKIFEIECVGKGAKAKHTELGEDK